MINLSKIDCVGCTACASICNKNVITMQRDEEGFLQPIILNVEGCNNCGLCEKVCPVINNKPEDKRIDRAFIVQNRDEKIRRESASGGMFSAIAISVLKNNGIVYGASYDSNFHVKHIGIENEEELWKLRNSKYVQSDLIGVYCEVKKHLCEGRQVCFSGTPCQIEGLQLYLRKKYTNLLLVDVVCHGVSSPLIWEKYLENIKKYMPNHIYFRWKHYGYKYSTMSIFDANNREVYFGGVESDKMLRAYFTNNCDRESCYHCLFKKRYRISDMTIWDCFQPRVFSKEFDDDLGTSCVLLNSEKGIEQFKLINSMNLVKVLEVDADDLTFGNNEMVGSVKRGKYRDTILVDANKLSSEELFDRYFPDTLLSKIKQVTRLLLVKIGIYNNIKFWVYLYRKKKTKR